MGKFIKDSLYYCYRYRMGKRNAFVSRYSNCLFNMICETDFEKNGNRFSTNDNYYKVYRIRKRV